MEIRYKEPQPHHLLCLLGQLRYTALLHNCNARLLQLLLLVSDEVHRVYNTPGKKDPYFSRACCALTPPYLLDSVVEDSAILTGHPHNFGLHTEGLTAGVR